MNLFLHLQHGGGKIKLKSMLAVLLLLTITLPFNANTVSATSQTPADTTNQTYNNEETNINNNQAQNNQQTLNSTSKTTINSSTAINSGSTEVSPKLSFSYSQINTKATNVKNFIETNKRLPNYVTISTDKITMPQFLQLLTENILKLNNGNKNTIWLMNVNSPPQLTGNLNSGKLYKTEYINLAQEVINTIKNTGSAPASINSTLGTINYENQVYIFSRLLNFYQSYERLPNYIAVKPLPASTSNEGITTDSANSTIPSSLQQYLKPTTNCQSTNSAIVSLSNSLTAGETTTYSKAVNIFNWVRNNIDWTGSYYNSAKGALGTLNSKTANCCDTSHLLIALMRAAGIPAKYIHGTCSFADGNFYGTYGHVWAQVCVDGKWYDADAVTSSNTFGVINNFKSYVLHGTYASLPF